MLLTAVIFCRGYVCILQATSMSSGLALTVDSTAWPGVLPRDLQLADSLVLRTISLIFYLRPRYWFIENPQTGLLKTRAFMHGLPYKDVSYCSYGMPYRKLTRIWTNFSKWQPRPLCIKDQCPFVRDGRHIATAQGGPGKVRGVRMSNDNFERRELYGIPAELCAEIVDCLTENLVV